MNLWCTCIRRNTFCKPGHKDAKCLCEQGFNILQGSFNLASWKNQSIEGVQFNLINLLENGHVARIIITEAVQLKLLNKYQQLVYIFHRMFKYDNLLGGFINLEFHTTPPLFEKYPANAPRHVKITLLRCHEPYQLHMQYDDFTTY